MVPLASAPLRLGPNARIRRHQASVIAEGYGAPVDCGPDGFSVLDLLRDDTTLAEIGTALGTRLRTPARWARAMTAVSELRAGGYLSPTHSEPAGDTTGFASAAVHIAMLHDTTRTERFMAAIRAAVRVGDVVVDIGTGTGILAIAAARAGARKVFAIEQSTMADVARAMVAANGVADQVSVIRGWSHQAELPERARVIVSETLGHNPWGEDILETLADARRRFGTHDVVTIPSGVKIWAVPVELPDEELRRTRFSTDDVAHWTTRYGIDFSPLVEYQAATAGPNTVRVESARAWIRAAPPEVLDSATFERAHAPTPQRRVCFRASRTGTVSGVMVYWDAELGPGIWLSTDPFAAGPGAHWRVRMLPLVPPLIVSEGDSFTLDVPLTSRGRSGSCRLAMGIVR